MIRTVPPVAVSIYVAALIAPMAAVAQDFTTPGGLEVALLDIALEPVGVRMRFVAPNLGTNGFAVEDMADEMGWICETQVAPAIAENNLDPTHVTISIAQQDIPLGEFDPDIAQIFDGYQVADGVCAWALYPLLSGDEIDEPEPEPAPDAAPATGGDN